MKGNANRRPQRDVSTWLLVLGLAVAVLAACTKKQYLTRFPHEKHLSNASCGAPGEPPCLTCATCHAGVAQDKSQSRPAVTVCTQCHADSANLTPFVTRPVPLAPDAHAIVFSHDQHLKMPDVGGQCIKCHSGAVSREASSALFPPMEACLNCHEHERQFEAGICTNCHAKQDLPRLRPESFARHDAVWLRHHGEGARRQEVLCQACHAEKDCTDCHDLFQNIQLEDRAPDAIERDLVHRADFMTRHAIEAAAQPTACVRCHEPQTCDGCHAQRGVSGNAVGALNPHPPGWTGSNTASPNFHGTQARRNLFECASCHEQGPATNCIRCHSSGGPGGNPHPRGWQSSRSPGEAMCRYCHGN